MRKPYVARHYRPHPEADSLQKILGLLFVYPHTEFSLSEVAEKARVAKSTASRAVEKLRKEGIVTVVKLGKVWRIRADYGNFSYKKMKIAFNLRNLLDTDIVERLEEKYHPKSVVLFGSYRKGEDAPGSDIDIAVEVSENTELQTLRLPEFRVYEERLGRNISVHLFNRKKINKDLFNNIANGIVLSGFLEVSP